MSDLGVGIHHGLSFAEYLKIDAINASTLKLFEKSPAHARQEMLVPREPTPALDLGHAVHAAVLEPDKFEDNYCKAPKVDRRTTKGKEAWLKFCDENIGKEIMKAEDYDQCVAMRGSVWAYDTAAAVLRGKGINESVIVWEDEKTGLLCKARPDRVTNYINWTVCADIKTTRNASPWAFGKDIHGYGWHVSAAFYLDGLQTVAPIKGERRFVFIAIEKQPPYCPVVFELDQTSIEQGRKDYRKYMKQYQTAISTGSWRGYPQGINPISIPSYAKGFDDIIVGASTL